MAQGKRWCFTLNNPGDVVPRFENCRYLIYGKEVGESGTPHLQGFVIFKSNKRLSACKSWLPGAHFETAKGTNEQASSYCKKDGAFVEEGDMPNDTAERKSIAWKSVIKSARSGTLEEDYPAVYVHNNRWYNAEYSAHRKLEPLKGTCGIWIMGESGVGKTHSVFTHFGIDKVYDKGVNKWWDGYRDEEVVLMDDVTPENGKFIGSFLLRWADKWPVRVETKGGLLRVRPKKIIITSNFAMREVFDANMLDMEALYRRFKCIVKLNKDQVIDF
ncbi:replication-associated protein [Capybara virus 30_cap3_1444]|nr:replication-associated protein [Capybara virus 30_cap3_1444]